jgi:hypothetical protein
VRACVRNREREIVRAHVLRKNERERDLLLLLLLLVLLLVLLVAEARNVRILEKDLSIPSKAERKQNLGSGFASDSVVLRKKRR